MSEVFNLTSKVQAVRLTDYTKLTPTITKKEAISALAKLAIEPDQSCCPNVIYRYTRSDNGERKDFYYSPSTGERSFNHDDLIEDKFKFTRGFGFDDACWDENNNVTIPRSRFQYFDTARGAYVKVYENFAGYRILELGHVEISKDPMNKALPIDKRRWRYRRTVSVNSGIDRIFMIAGDTNAYDNNGDPLWTEEAKKFYNPAVLKYIMNTIYNNYSIASHLNISNLRLFALGQSKEVYNSDPDRIRTYFAIRDWYTTITPRGTSKKTIAMKKQANDSASLNSFDDIKKKYTWKHEGPDSIHSTCMVVLENVNDDWDVLRYLNRKPNGTETTCRYRGADGLFYYDYNIVSEVYRIFISRKKPETKRFINNNTTGKSNDEFISQTPNAYMYGFSSNIQYYNLEAFKSNPITAPVAELLTNNANENIGMTINKIVKTKFVKELMDINCFDLAKELVDIRGYGYPVQTRIRDLMNIDIIPEKTTIKDILGTDNIDKLQAINKTMKDVNTAYPKGYTNASCLFGYDRGCVKLLKDIYGSEELNKMDLSRFKEFVTLMAPVCHKIDNAAMFILAPGLYNNSTSHGYSSAATSGVDEIFIMGKGHGWSRKAEGLTETAKKMAKETIDRIFTMDEETRKAWLEVMTCIAYDNGAWRSKIPNSSSEEMREWFKTATVKDLKDLCIKNGIAASI